MKKYISEFSLNAHTEAEAKEKMAALSALASKLSARSLTAMATKLSAGELEKIAEVIDNPVKLLFAKQKLGI